MTREQLKMLEALTGQEYTLKGTPRKRPRTPAQAHRIGLPHRHDRLREMLRIDRLAQQENN